MNKSAFLVAAFVSFIFFSSQPCFSKTEKPFVPPDIFVGEELKYDVGYWIFPNALKARVSFERHDDGYVSEFEAWTAGVVRVVAGDRRGKIKTVLEYDADKGRLRPLFFEEVFNAGKRVWKKQLSFDYNKQRYTYIRINSKGNRTKITKKMPSGDFDDILSAFFNFRMGYFGRIGEKKDFKFNILVKEKLSIVDIIFDGTWEKHDLKKSYYSEVSVERDISYLGTNKLSLWFSEDYLPTHGVVKNAYYFGNLTLKLAGDSKKQKD